MTASPEPERDDESAARAPRARLRWFRARNEVVWLFLLALGIRAAVAYVNPAILPDSVTLLRLSAEVGREGIGAVIGSSEHPLVPWIISLFPRALDAETGAIALSVFAGAFAVWPLHTIARRACGRHAATAASIIYAALPKAVGIATVPHASAVLLPLLLSGLALAMVAPLGQSRRRRRVRRRRIRRVLALRFARFARRLRRVPARKRARVDTRPVPPIDRGTRSVCGVAGARLRGVVARLVGSGVMCGLAYLCRPEGAVAAFGAVVAAFAMAQKGRRLASAAIVSAAFVLLAAPYAIALSHHAGRFELTPKKSLAKVVGVDQTPADESPVEDSRVASDLASKFGGALPAPVIVFVLAGIAVPRRWRRGPGRRARLVVLHMAAVFVALLLRVRWGWGYSAARHMLTSGVLLLPFAGEGLHFIGGFISRMVARRRLTVVLASFFAIPCAVLCVTQPEGATHADARALGELLARQTPGDGPVVVASFAEPLVAYYAERTRGAPVSDLRLWRSFGGTGPDKKLARALDDARVRSGDLRDALREGGARWLVIDLFKGGPGGGPESPGRALAAKLIADGIVTAPATSAGSSLAAFAVR